MRRLLNRFVRAEDGAAAMEMAFVGGMFIVGAMSAADVGRYAYQTDASARRVQRASSVRAI